VHGSWAAQSHVVDDKKRKFEIHQSWMIKKENLKSINQLQNQLAQLAGPHCCENNLYRRLPENCFLLC
jgi:hypothetical protein